MKAGESGGVQRRIRPGALRPLIQMETVLEEFEVYNPISLMIGSCVGGLLLLALITASLYKVSASFFPLSTG